MIDDDGMFAYFAWSVLHGVTSLCHNLLDIILCANNSIPDLSQKALVAWCKSDSGRPKDKLKAKVCLYNTGI